MKMGMLDPDEHRDIFGVIRGWKSLTFCSPIYAKKKVSVNVPWEAANMREGKEGVDVAAPSSKLPPKWQTKAMKKPHLCLRTENYISVNNYEYLFN